MGRSSSVQEFLVLADSVRVAADLADRKGSLEQACRESEARLKSLRDEESKAGASIAAAHAEGARLTAAATVKADSAIERANAEAAEKWSACETACRKRETLAIAALYEQEQRAKAAAKRADDLEAEETKLGQSVASLRADLAALRAKLG